MTDMSDGPGRSGKYSDYFRVSDGLREITPGIARLLLVDGQGGTEVRLKRRGQFDWLCLVKRETDEGGRQIVFGMGVGPIEALTYADGLVQAGRWRVDKPWSASDAGG